MTSSPVVRFAGVLDVTVLTVDVICGTVPVVGGGSQFCTGDLVSLLLTPAWSNMTDMIGYLPSLHPW